MKKGSFDEKTDFDKDGKFVCIINFFTRVARNRREVCD